jgi:hypothetical protein
VVHRYAPIDRFRRTVSRAAWPALIPLRAATSSLPDVFGLEDHPAPDADPRAEPLGSVSTDRQPGVAATPAEGRAASRADQLESSEELEELEAMRAHLDAAPDLRADVSTERAQRATRSASAYLEARRARLKRELRELRERS